VSTLADLVRARTDLRDADVDWLHRLVSEWQLLADLSFADLVLRVRTTEGGWLAVAHMRPTTGPTTWPEDVVGTEVPSAAVRQLERAAVAGRTVRVGEAQWQPGKPVRADVVCVSRGDRVLAVLTREADTAAARMPSALELTYLTTAGELLQMIGEGRFPFEGPPVDAEHAPRVGDGLMRLDRTGHVVYASPNALSAYRRLGVSGDLLGAHLGSTVARLAAGPGVLDEPRASAALAAVLRFGEPRESEVEAQGATVLLRALPLAPGGEPRGALVLVRDVTELRHRDRQLMGKDATIREIHHRVKNNLQTVAALLRLQARRVESPQAQAALEESVRRVASIAWCTRRSRRRSRGRCPSTRWPTGSSPCARRWRRRRRRSRSGAAAASASCPPRSPRPWRWSSPSWCRTPWSTATRRRPAGHRRTGRPRAGRAAGQVRDDGAGLPDGFDLDASTALGLRIVRTLVEGELRGSLSLRQRDGGGTLAQVRVPSVRGLTPPVRGRDRTSGELRRCGSRRSYAPR
jgi:two-component sensor histidine kinase